MTRFAFTMIILAALLAGREALAHGYEIGSIRIGHPNALATPPSATRGAAYLKLTNGGTEADALVGASGAIAERIEIHTSSVVDGIAQMRPLPEGVPVGPGETVELAPGGVHLMLIGLKAPLVEGKKVPITLQFRKTGTIEVELAVEAPAGVDVHAGH